MFILLILFSASINAEIYYTATQDLKLYNQPNGEVIDTVNIGYSFSQNKVLEQKAEWFKIEYSGNEGWIINKYLDFNEGSIDSTNDKYTNKSEKILNAYRDIYFGETQSIVEQKCKNDNKIDEIVPGGYTIEIGEYEYSLTFEYYKGQLYRLEFTGYRENADYFDTIVKDKRNEMVKVIEKVYGTADKKNNINFLDMKSNYIIWSHIWNQGDKEIKIGIAESDFNYFPKMYIIYTPLAKQKEEEEKNKKENKINDSSEDF